MKINIIIKSILDELELISGFSNWWDSLSEETKKEIFNKLLESINNENI